MEALAGFGAQNRTGRGRPSRIICTAETWPGGHLLAGRPRYSTVFNAAGGAGSYRRRSPRIETASTSRASIMAPMTTRRAMSTRSMAAVCRTPRRGARWRGRQAGGRGRGENHAPMGPMIYAQTVVEALGRYETAAGKWACKAFTPSRSWRRVFRIKFEARPPDPSPGAAHGVGSVIRNRRARGGMMLQSIPAGLR